MMKKWILMSLLACSPWTASAQSAPRTQSQRLETLFENALLPRRAAVLKECSGAVSLEVLITDLEMTASCAKGAPRTAAQAVAVLRLTAEQLGESQFGIYRFSKESPRKHCLPEIPNDCADSLDETPGLPILMDLLSIQESIRKIQAGERVDSLQKRIVLQVEIDQAFREALQNLRLKQLEENISKTLYKITVDRMDSSYLP